jgi:multidrug efflux pump subunit AcrA (membrane-fusion protein)
MKVWAIFPVVTASLIAAGCSSQKPVEAAGTAITANAAKTLAVSTAAAVSRNVGAAFEETGSFEADETSDIAPAAAGRVIATPVNVGDFVRKGQVICELDHRDAQLKLDQAKAQLDQATAAVRQSQARIGLAGAQSFVPDAVPEVAAAKANFDSATAQARLAAADGRRYQNLVATGDVSQSTYEKYRTQQETAEAQATAARRQYEAALNTAREGLGAVENSQASLEAMRSQLGQAEKALADTTIRAPFDGSVTARAVAVGEWVVVTPPTKLATIVRIGTLKLQLQTPEQLAAGVKLGMQVVARVAAYPDRDFTGTVTAINPSVDPSSRMFLAEAKFPNGDAKLRPGMFATAKIVRPGGENGIFVPATAVWRDKTTDSFQVFAVENGAAKMHVVVVGESAGDSARILSGLTGNEIVATNHLSELYDGAPVQAAK